jgi:hypothetical protein
VDFSLRSNESHTGTSTPQIDVRKISGVPGTNYLLCSEVSVTSNPDSAVSSDVIGCIQKISIQTIFFMVQLISHEKASFGQVTC